jgi:hypothetical protein
MNQEMLYEFGNLWTTDKDRYVLLAPGPDFRVEQLVIMNRETKMAKIIEDNDAYKEVIELMREAGVPVTCSMPKD